MDKVRQSNFVVIIGASGSGKSSVLRAGLLHQLDLGRKVSGSEQWQIHIMLPGEHPLQNLALAFVDADLSQVERAKQLGEAEDLISQGEIGLRRLVQASGSSRVVLVIDQFEEVFTLCQDHEERQQFFQCLLGSLALTGDQLCLILAMRADFFSKCVEQEYNGLAQKIQQNLVAVIPMTPAELKQSITEPAKRVGLEVEPGLAEQMLTDIAGSPGSLPLLQYTLTELWKQRGGNCLQLSHYVQLGGVMGTLQKRATEVYESFSAAQQATIRHIFLALTQLGEGTEDTRRRVLKHDLVTSQHSEALIDEVVRQLADEKLVVTSELVGKGGPSGRAAVVDVAHEALIRHWPKLRQWVNENRHALRTQRDVEADARDWQTHDQAKDYLLRGLKLAEAEDFLQQSVATLPLSNLAQTFVANSQTERNCLLKIEEERRQQEIKQARMIAVGSISAVLVLTGLTVLSGIQLRRLEIEQIRTSRAHSAINLVINQGIEARIESVKVGRRLQRSFWQAIWPTPELHTQVLHQLVSTFYSVQERNRLEGHKGWISSVVFSPEGATLATSGEDGTARLWDRSGEALATLIGHEGRVYNVVFSPDGATLATSGEDGTARLWDRSGKALATLTGHEGRVDSVAFSPDGATLATGGEDGTARLWDRSGEALATLTGHVGWVYSVVFSPDGATLATGGEDGTARLWDRSGKALATLTGHEGRVYSVVFSPDGATLATGGEDGTARLWDRSGKALATLTGYEGWVTSVAFSPDGATLATGGEDGTARLWDRSDEELATLIGHEGRVTSVVFSPDGATLATSGLDGTARLWNRSGEKLATLIGHVGRVDSVAFSPDGATLATSGLDGTARLWNRSGEELATLTGHVGLVYSVVFSPDGATLATSGLDGTARLWNRSGEELATLTGHEGRVDSVAFSPDGATLATSGLDGTARLWNCSGEELATLTGHEGRVDSVAFSPDGATLATSGLDGTARLWNRSGEELATLTGHVGLVYSVVFSPDGTTLATRGADGTVRLWDRSGEELATLTGHEGLVYSVVFSPDGTTLATRGLDGTARLWDRSGEELATLTGHEGFVYSVVFSPDGAILATSGADGTARLWQVSNLDVLLERNCEGLRDYLSTHPNAEEDRELCKGIGDDP